jgi:hypothetical protein
MKLPEIDNAGKYVGLYVVDFGDSCSVGFTAREVAELLESERFRNIKIYKIHKAYPDGKMELKGVQGSVFELEAGMFFYAADMETAQSEFDELVKLAVRLCPPERAKVHLSRYGDGRIVTAVIYPAEYDDEFSDWLLKGDYKTAGAADAGIGAVGQYYAEKPEILQRHQLFGREAVKSRSGRELLAAMKLAVQR